MKSFASAAVVLLGVPIMASSSPALAHQGLDTKHKANHHSHAVATAHTEAQPPAASPAPNVVSVMPGDYLEKLASENGTTSLRIFYANTDIVNPDLIYPDQKLRIPATDETLATRPVPANTQVATPSSSESTRAAAPQQSAGPRTSATPYTAVSASNTGVWDSIAACEAGGNWSINTGNGFYGGLQFTLSSWQAVGGTGYPNEASREEQIARGQILQSRQGWSAWPACTTRLGIG